MAEVTVCIRPGAQLTVFNPTEVIRNGAVRTLVTGWADGKIHPGGYIFCGQKCAFVGGVEGMSANGDHKGIAIWTPAPMSHFLSGEIWRTSDVLSAGIELVELAHG